MLWKDGGVKFSFNYSSMGILDFRLVWDLRDPFHDWPGWMWIMNMQLAHLFSNIVIKLECHQKQTKVKEIDYLLANLQKKSSVRYENLAL